VAGPAGRPSIDLKLDLVRNGRGYAFFQVMRLLRLFGRGGPCFPEGEGKETDRIRVRPELSLGFPASDVARVEEVPGEDGCFRVTATFLGLYGSSSPLPTFYTEDLLEEAGEDASAARDFLDIVNHRLYLFLFECWTKYKPFLRVVEENRPEDVERLFCLVGLGEEALRESLPEPYALLRYSGLLTQQPRSAMGLVALLRDALGDVPVAVVPCVPRKTGIPMDQRLCLGTAANRLGEESVLGEEIDDRMGKFRLRIGPLDVGRFHALLPGGPEHGRLADLTRFYLKDPLEFDIELRLAEGEVRTACLGGPKWATLGRDTWTFAADRLQTEVKAVFPPDPIRRLTA
jgi:type VI secretion system protein ImpH